MSFHFIVSQTFFQKIILSRDLFVSEGHPDSVNELYERQKAICQFSKRLVTISRTCALIDQYTTTLSRLIIDKVTASKHFLNIEKRNDPPF